MDKSQEKKIIKSVKKAKFATLEMAGLSTELKNKALSSVAVALTDNMKFIMDANLKDLNAAKKPGLSSAFIDRMKLTESRINNMSKSLSALIDLQDPVGDIIEEWSVRSGLKISKIRVPVGLILIIYESRPDVTSDCIGLCLKSGNCVILRGGSEAINSNLAIFEVFLQVLRSFSIPEGAVNFVSTTERQAVNLLLKMDDYIDLVIPRGGENLVRKISSVSRIPVIKHYKGICHVYVDRSADLDMAETVCFNAKVQRPGTCNAMETMLVHNDIATKFLPVMIKHFIDSGVQIRGCRDTLKIIKALSVDKSKIKRATETDYRTEYLDLILSVKVVRDSGEAIRHINTYGSHHSDAIIAGDNQAAEEFLKKVDSACVYYNASTRFTDGYQFGMGAEIGISTDRLHARGPMALKELTTYKYIIRGNGQIRT